MESSIPDDVGKFRETLSPDILKYWFFWRPVIENVVSFKEMWVDEAFTFIEILSMHELLDYQSFTTLATRAYPKNEAV